MGRRRRSVLAAAMGLALSAIAGNAAAQATGAQAGGAPSGLERFERRAEQIQRETIAEQSRDLSATDRMLADYGGYLTLGYYSIDDAAGRNHVLRQYELLGYARLNLDNAQELFLRGRAGYRDFGDGDSFDNRGDEPIDPDLDRGYYRVDLRDRTPAAAGRPGAANDGVVLQFGRDLSYWANGLVLAQVLDGATASATYGPFQLDVVAGVTVTRTVDFDASRPRFDHNTRRGFYGAMLSGRWGAHRPYAYFLAQQDYNRSDASQVGLIRTRFNYNSTYLGVGSAGALSDRLVYGVEAAFEGGRGLSNSFRLETVDDVPVLNGDPPKRPVQDDQRDELIRAFAVDARLDYLVTDARRTRLSAEFIYASGDSDRFHTSDTLGGNRRGSDDHAFNGFGALNTGLAFAPAVSNLAAVRAGASTFPFATGDPWSRLQLGADFFVFAKARAEAPIDEVSRDKHYLGVEPDFFLNWQLTNDLTLAARYGLFFPGGALDGESRQFIFLGMTYAF